MERELQIELGRTVDQVAPVRRERKHLIGDFLFTLGRREKPRRPTGRSISVKNADHRRVFLNHYSLLKERAMPSANDKSTKNTRREECEHKVDLLDPASHDFMHHEHAEWLSDIANWRDDLVEWGSETRRVLSELKQLESMLQQHDTALIAHSEELLKHRQKLVKHEHSLASFEQNQVGDDLPQGSRDHRQERESHANHQTFHEAIKKRHRRLVAYWMQLRNELSQLPVV